MNPKDTTPVESKREKTKPPARTLPAARATSEKPTARVPANSPPKTPTQPAGTTSKTDSSAEESSLETGKKRRFLSGAPSWLVSTVVHLVVFLVLALVTFSTSEEVRKIFVAGEMSEEMQELEVFEPIEMNLEPTEMEQVSTEPVSVVDPGMANLGEAAPMIAVADGGLALDSFESTIDEIGSLLGESGRGMTDFAKGAGGAEFFGVKAGGRKFVFIVDSSKSMNGGKFEAACEELLYAIRRLSKEQYFYVMFFDWDAAKMTFAPNSEPEPRAVPATAENINKLGQWVSTVELELKTNPFDAVEFAVKMLPDAIYVLTDGKFTDGGRTEKWLKQNNKLEDPIDGVYPKVVIHTIGFWQPDGEPTLKAIANEYGGTYRFVPRPIGKPKR